MEAAYTAIFTIDPGDKSVNVHFPDIPGCLTFGHSMVEALKMAEDAANQVLIAMEDGGGEIPAPTPCEEIETPAGSVASMIVVNTTAWRKKLDGRAVRKNVSLPSWLAARADALNINLSQLLQGALLERIEHSN